MENSAWLVGRHRSGAKPFPPNANTYETVGPPGTLQILTELKQAIDQRAW